MEPELGDLEPELVVPVPVPVPVPPPALRRSNLIDFFQASSAPAEPEPGESSN